MRSQRPDILALVILMAAAGSPAELRAETGPGLGIPMDSARVSAMNLTVLPDGTGLPPGSGRADTGAEVYARHCQACHGPAGSGGPNDALVGGSGTLATQQPVKTVGSYWPYATTVFDYIRRAMPYQAPGSLSADEVYAVTAYLLYENGIIEAGEIVNARSLPRIRMPNRDGFHNPYQPSMEQPDP